MNKQLKPDAANASRHQEEELDGSSWLTDPDFPPVRIDPDGRRWHILLPDLKTGEVARYLGVSTQTVRRLIYSGRLGAHRRGRIFIIVPADLRRYVHANPRKSQ